MTDVKNLEKTVPRTPLNHFVQRQPNPVFSPEYRALIAVLKAARTDACLSQRTLARRIGKSSSHVVRIEMGQRRVDALELYRIAKALGVEPLELFARIVKRLDATVEGPDIPGRRNHSMA
jgi:ribosome-binding protein aMBF1 (putative translation factor)